MFRKPFFWILFVLFSLVCIAFTYHYFPKAFPVVSINITMDRQMAMDRATQLSEKFNWGPEGYHRAASYNLDSQVKNYTELETGGADAFRDMLEAGLYSPYTWQVRHFKEQDVNETLIRFTPKGEPYGFRITLSENTPGYVLTPDSARSIAETEAAGFWETDIENFVLVESSENLRPGGRLDHTFVYERENEKIGEADYRLRLGVSGNRFTELTHFVRIPESFNRQFEEMRSANNTLANGASIAMIILFLMGGCGLGLFYLIKQRYILWKQPVIWGTFVAFLVTLSTFNSWPLQWMSYDTALSFQNHVIEQVAMAVLGFIGMALVFSIIFMTAESLTRKAFPNHIQFWKLWSAGAASSRQVLGITLAAFLLVGYELSYVTGTYFLTSQLLGWWYPSSALFNPNIIAEYFPWFTAFVISLQAAFWEEALFRAIPIAGAVLLGRRFGKTTLWVIAAFVLQAVIFGAGHADYPQQPFYARTAELIIPSIIFGLIYYFIGLYAAILIHFWYNFVWFSISIFSASTPGIIVDQIMLIIVGLLPFWVILFRFFRTRSLGEIPEDVLNGSWVPRPGKVKTTREPLFHTGHSPLVSPLIKRTVVIGGIAGLAIWLMFTDFRKDADPVVASRSDAVEFAKQEIYERDFEIDVSKNWQVFSRVYGGINMQHRFIWQEGGEEAYQNLLGSYLVPPVWHVRLALFEGSQEERAEEFHIYIAGRDSVNSFRHILPESRPGASLEEAEARRIAEETITGIHRLNPEGLRFISAESSSLPDRTDWTIIYADSLNYPLEIGEARIRVRIAGDELVGTNRFIHVPEEWSREYRDGQTISNTIETTSNILMVLLFLSGLIAAIIRWTKGEYSVRAFLIMSAGVLLLMCLNTYNSWPLTQIGFSTAQPYLSQAMTNIGFSAVGWFFISITLGLITGLIQKWNLPVSRKLAESPFRMLSYAILPMLVVLGTFALISGTNPPSAPDWGFAGYAGSSFPVLAGALNPAIGFISAVILSTLIFGGVHKLTNGWTKRKLLFGSLLFLAAFPLMGLSVENVTSWILAGTIAGALLLLFYIKLLRYHMPLIVIMGALYVIINYAATAFTPMYSGGSAAFLLSLVLIAGIAWFWYKKLVSAQIKNSSAETGKSHGFMNKQPAYEKTTR